MKRLYTKWSYPAFNATTPSNRWANALIMKMSVNECYCFVTLWKLSFLRPVRWSEMSKFTGRAVRAACLRDCALGPSLRRWWKKVGQSKEEGRGRGDLQEIKRRGVWNCTYAWDEKRDGRSKKKRGKNVCVLIQRPKTWQVRAREKKATYIQA